MARLTEVPDVRVTKNTGKALLVVLDEGEGDEVWVPCSVVDETSEVNDAGDEGTLVVQSWFAKKEDKLADYVDD
jgi:hypothetical protein